MASQVFSFDYSSSEKEFEAQPSRFNIEDLPNLNIPYPFQSDSSGWESPTSPGNNVASPPETPATPLSPGSSLGGPPGEGSWCYFQKRMAIYNI